MTTSKHTAGLVAVAAAVLLLAAALPLQAAATCVINDCNGHGACEYIGSTWKCICVEDYDGVACERHRCPTGPAWTGPGDGSGGAHLADAECSNGGKCDYSRGKCSCYRDYIGSACQRMKCPSANTRVCSGHGVCRSMREASKRANQTDELSAYHYNLWDADMIHHCVCDEGFTGHNCNQRTCPKGDDPLSYGTREIQSVRITADHRDEIQLVTISGTAGSYDDEVQTWGFSDGNTGVIPLTGFFTLTFTTTQANCDLCTTHASQTTGLINVLASAATVETALEALSNIDDVTVTRSTNVGAEGYQWTVTFVGDAVPGNVPAMTVSPTLYGDSPSSIGLTTPTPGTHVTGYFTLTYDDTDASNKPTGSVGSTTSGSIYMNAYGSEVATTLTSMTNIVSTTVTRIDVGGPGLQFSITFTGNYGNIVPLTCDASNLASATCVISTTQDGFWVEGSWSLAVGSWGTLSSLDVDVTAASLDTQIEALSTTLGEVEVSRANFPVTPTTDWTNTFTWLITFIHQTADVPDLVALDVSLSGADNIAVTVGTESSKLDGSELDAANVQVNEVQLIECTCSATCSGSTKFTFRGKTSAAVDHDASAATLKTALEDMETIGGVIVTMIGDSATMCDATGMTTLITFTHDPGDVPPLQPTDVTIASSGATANFWVRADPDVEGNRGGITRRGSRENVECSNRGQCDRSTGLCSCYTNFASSNGAGLDVAAAAGDRLDCGYNSVALSACSASVAGGGGGGDFGACSGRGTCSGAPQYLCTCDSGFYGGACEFITCPSATAWSDFATATDTAHATAECSNRGQCTEDVGTCACDGNFNKDASANNCNKQPCVDDDCGDVGTCYSLSALVPLITVDDDDMLTGATYTGWDKDMLHGCQCNTIYAGLHEWGFATYYQPGCTSLTCPYGDDPHTIKDDNNKDTVNEVQRLNCSATGGTFTLSFRGQTTNPIQFDALLTASAAGHYNAGPLENELEALSTIRNVTIVSVEADHTTVCHADNAGVDITFVTETGDIPLLTISSSVTGGTVTVAEATKGTKDWLECSNRGTCDTTTGRCKCAEQYGSSDGEGRHGRLGDCGHLHIFYGSNGKFAL